MTLFLLTLFMHYMYFFFFFSVESAMHYMYLDIFKIFFLEKIIVLNEKLSLHTRFYNLPPFIERNRRYTVQWTNVVVRLLWGKCNVVGTVFGNHKERLGYFCEIVFRTCLVCAYISTQWKLLGYVGPISLNKSVDDKRSRQFVVDRAIVLN